MKDTFHPGTEAGVEWKYEDGRIYSVNGNDRLVAETTYVRRENGEADIDHTYVDPEFRGRGIAGRMLEAVAEHFRKSGIKTTATCSYAALWLKKHREKYADILSEDIDNETISCKIDSRH